MNFFASKRKVNDVGLTKREKIFASIMILIVVFGWTYFKSDGVGQQKEVQLDWTETAQLEAEEKDEKQETPQKYVVDVKGAVKSPGVYEVEKGERVIDVVREAGGLIKEADQKQINLAGLLQDEMVVYVPFEGEEAQTWTVSAVSPGSSDEGKINVNTAEGKELEQLPGIGPAKASAIIAYRDEHGPFKTVEDLLDVSGIGEKSLQQMKEMIALPETES
jgi:competence protein ComEA